VLEPAFLWAGRSDWSGGWKTALICSNCDHLKIFVGDALAAEADPDRATYAHLPHPPFQLDLDRVPEGDLRIEGYLAGKKVIEKRCSSRGVDRHFQAVADDTRLVADGADATRVVLRVTDEFGAVRRYSTAAIAFHLEGPAEIIGDNPFSLMGGCGAIWIRAKDQPGIVRLRATHPVLGVSEVEIQITAGEPEIA
jgi:beta-galactosidase